MANYSIICIITGSLHAVFGESQMSHVASISKCSMFYYRILVCFQVNCRTFSSHAVISERSAALNFSNFGI